MLAYCAGFPLGPIEKTGRDLLQATEKYHVEFIRILVFNSRTVMLHLMGLNDTALEWSDLDKIKSGVTAPSDIL
jgi:hypothetical protein